MSEILYRRAGGPHCLWLALLSSSSSSLSSKWWDCLPYTFAIECMRQCSTEGEEKRGLRVRNTDRKGRLESNWTHTHRASGLATINTRSSGDSVVGEAV
ncbi:hypothetical protein EDB89DRAFT_1953897 [Lactarius sanguifluus]|nr:hypothetical protein EDB89DRAFT_1953897 [Lactarius sanguifluus]